MGGRVDRQGPGFNGIIRGEAIFNRRQGYKIDRFGIYPRDLIGKGF